jgi:hypothetical protein
MAGITVFLAHTEFRMADRQRKKNKQLPSASFPGVRHSRSEHGYLDPWCFLALRAGFRAWDFPVQEQAGMLIPRWQAASPASFTNHKRDKRRYPAMQMKTLKKIGVLSAGKMGAGVFGAMGVIIGVIYAAIGFVAGGVAMAGGEEGGMLGFALGAGAIILMPLIYIVLGFLYGLFVSFVFNLVAGHLGGVELWLDED